MPARLLPLLLLCFATFCACSRDGRDRSPQGVRLPATGEPGSRGIAASEVSVAPGAYPYDLFLGSSLYHVEQETERGRLRVELAKWSEGPDGGKDAVFRVTNPGDRPVLVWNVRQQACVPGSNGVTRVWETRHHDYPGRGWERAAIAAGGSEEFPMASGGDGEWRVCLLYSREMADSKAPNRRFDGTFEAIGPGVVEAD